MHSPKIATCCFCGTRAALVLRGEDRHELCCASCGAPLHNLKYMPARDAEPERRKGTGARSTSKVRSKDKAEKPKALARPEKKKRKRVKKSKPRLARFLRNAFEEAVDAIEDVFD